jgi:hypothetical protein
MQIKQSELKKILTEELEKYTGGEFEGYKYGKPDVAAQKLEKILNKFINDVGRALTTAGGFMGPAIFAAFKKDLYSRLKELKTGSSAKPAQSDESPTDAKQIDMGDAFPQHQDIRKFK